jgi:hypothetical protein
VMMTTTVARRMINGRELFWIRIVIAFILFGFLFCWFLCVAFLRLTRGSFNRNPVPHGTRNPPHEALWNSDLTSGDSGLQLDLEMALNGVSASIHPHGLFLAGRRCVETSDDVIDEAFS